MSAPGIAGVAPHDFVTVRMLREIRDRAGVLCAVGELVVMTRQHVIDNLLPDGWCEIVAGVSYP
jgi:hypothetical protein